MDLGELLIGMGKRRLGFIKTDMKIVNRYNIAIKKRYLKER